LVVAAIPIVYNAASRSSSLAKNPQPNDLPDGRVLGVLVWNVGEQVDAARKLIAEPGPFRHESLKGRLPA
jgi:hypothetical protein